jgi:hypothetical protein
VVVVPLTGTMRLATPWSAIRVGSPLVPVVPFTALTEYATIIESEPRLTSAHEYGKVNVQVSVLPDFVAVIW